MERGATPNMGRWRQQDLEVRPCPLYCFAPNPTHSATLVVFRLVVERGDHQSRYKKNGEREENVARRARKSPSKEAISAKSLSFGPTTTLDYRQGRQLEFCHRGLQDPLDHPRMVRTPSGVYPWDVGRQFSRVSLSVLVVSSRSRHSFPIELVVSSLSS